ncbi:MAG: phosphotransferase [Oscillospiraceae bacterium]|nr:phosphotransferase [Oscillospiraceae bacterium]
MQNILSIWGLAGITVKHMDSLSMSTWDVGGQYILKRYSNDEELSRSMQFSKLLTTYGIPVAVFIPTESGKLTSPEGSYCLMSKLSGKHPDFFEEINLASEMGRELARLHTVLAHIEPNLACNDSDLLVDWQNGIKPSIEKLVPDKMLGSVDILFRKYYPNLPRQLIHRDIHCHNVLFDNGHLTGWLDFDISQRNARLFDMAYLLSGLLVGNTHSRTKIDKWRLIYHELLTGYNEINPLVDNEHDALPILMIMIELLFAWFWIGRDNIEQSETALELAKWLCNEYNI